DKISDARWPAGLGGPLEFFDGHAVRAAGGTSPAARRKASGRTRKADARAAGDGRASGRGECRFLQQVLDRGWREARSSQRHPARILPVDGRPHSAIRQWNGDYVARWEGDTLVVDSINFINTAGITDPRIHGQGIGQHGHLIERFRRLDADTLLYSFTIEDPD